MQTYTPENDPLIVIAGRLEPIVPKADRPPTDLALGMMLGWPWRIGRTQKNGCGRINAATESPIAARIDALHRHPLDKVPNFAAGEEWRRLLIGELQGQAEGRIWGAPAGEPAGKLGARAAARPTRRRYLRGFCPPQSWQKSTDLTPRLA